ncbi:universal stress protein [Halobacterium litoreum]|uniref:Universal stress protein n=1 Tax=Halobacterium litoreum TaxID=2039234 RepID=A0ABD5NDF2_9EURY|nr:universal stress protein [Halobacterium litoreum]UHH13919.1 universal stress protein [Halobacterium litoreum]
MYDRILVPTDESESMSRVYEHAADIAARRDATVHVLYVLDDRAFLTLDEEMQDEATEQLREGGDAALARATEQFEDAGVSVETATREGDPAEEILTYADEAAVDLVVMGTRRENFEQTMLGSVSRQVVESADVPVLTMSVAEE